MLNLRRLHELALKHSTGISDGEEREVFGALAGLSDADLKKFDKEFKKVDAAPEPQAAPEHDANPSTKTPQSADYTNVKGKLVPQGKDPKRDKKGKSSKS